MRTNLFAAIKKELSLWQQNGQQCHFWWRDDDATQDTPALQKLIDLHQQTKIPVALSVIPKFAHVTLLQQIKNLPQISILQHGWQHRNYELPEQPFSEFGSSRDSEIIRQELRTGRNLLKAMFAKQFVTGFVAPWNNLAAKHWPEFDQYDLVSFHDGAANQMPSKFKQLNVHIDILRWRKYPKFRGTTRTIKAILKQLKQRRTDQQFDKPIGIMSHHLVMDNASWQFLTKLLNFLRQESVVQFLDIQSLSKRWASNDNKPIPAATHIRVYGDVTAKVAVASNMIF